MRLPALAAVVLMTGCANYTYTPPSDADFAAMRSAVQAMQPQVVMPPPNPMTSCWTAPSGNALVTSCF